METRLSLEPRSATGKGGARKLRQAGRVPAVVYGGDDDPMPVSMKARDALHLFHSISVDNTILELDIDGVGTEQALIRDIQTHPHRDELIHVDFQRIQKGVAIEVQIPIQLVGTPDGVRNEGGLLDHIVHDLPVKCIPSAIPEFIQLDVTDLVIGDALRAKDLALPADVESLLDPERTICLVAAPRVVEEEAPEELAEGLEGEEGEEGEEGAAPTGESGSDASEGDQDEG